MPFNQYKFKKNTFYAIIFLVFWGYNMKSRIVYMGTPQFSAVILEALVEKGYNIVAVVSQADKKVGRKQEIVYSKVKEVALKYNIPVLQPKKIKDEYQGILDYKPDCIITCAYGQIVPDEILSFPKYKCINIHASLLPKYRGGAPIHKAIMNGDKESGVSIMEMVSKMDAGAVCYVKKHPISFDTTTTQLFTELAQVGKEAILEILPNILSGNVKFEKQDESKVSYAYTIKKEEEKIDITQTALEIYNHIRGLSDVPGAYILINNKKIKLFDVKYIERAHNQFGKIEFSLDHFNFYFKDGIVQVKTLQMEGKVKMDAKIFYNGYGKSFTSF